MAASTLVATGLQSNEQAMTNCAYVNPGELSRLAAAAGVEPEVALKKGLLCAVGEAVLLVRALDSAMPGKICVSALHRLAGQLSPDKPCAVRHFEVPAPPFFLGRLQLEMSVQGGSASDAPIVVDAGEMSRILAETFNGHVLKLQQAIVCNYQPEGEAGRKATLKFVVLGFEYSDLAGGAAAGGGGAKPAMAAFGQINKKLTTIELVKNAKANIKITGSSSGKANQLFEKGFNFEEMGIGGLDAQFKEIFRRAFASRLVPPDILKKMGQHHIRGMLLFGPPGCGKTLIARKIGKALHAKPPKIVNGPEILNKYVGASEENIRALFKDAEEEQAEKGDDSELHIIIFDEFDAISKQRGTTGGGTGVNDSIVNQLLSKIDGVESLNNVLIIAMTNRKDMIDEAVLRPGRLELHVEIGLPDEDGRKQILAIHTHEIRQNGFLDPRVDLNSIAARTKNYTGAEIEGLIKAACSYVFSRGVDLTNLTKAADFSGIMVGPEDFERALSECQPAFGVREDELAQCISNGIISHGAEFDRVKQTLVKMTQQVLNSSRTPLVSVMLTGPRGAGKSALAADLALNGGFPFVKRITGESLVGLHEEGRASVVQKAFRDAYKSPSALVILDDIERIMEYVPVGQRFSNQVLQTLLVLVKAQPPPGHRLMVIGTSSIPDMLEAMQVTDSFDLCLPIPPLATAEQFSAVLSSGKLLAMSAPDVAAVSEHLAGKSMGIKKLLSIVEMCRIDESGYELPRDAPIPAEKVFEVLLDWSL
jgi:vesicle-fusing ATPase